MQVTKELLTNAIFNTKNQIEEAKALLHQRSGALVVLEDLVKYMDSDSPENRPQVEEPEDETPASLPSQVTSEENARIQDEEENRQEAYRLALGDRINAAYVAAEAENEAREIEAKLIEDLEEYY